MSLDIVLLFGPETAEYKLAPTRRAFQARQSSSLVPCRNRRSRTPSEFMMAKQAAQKISFAWTWITRPPPLFVRTRPKSVLARLRFGLLQIG